MQHTHSFESTQLNGAYATIGMFDGVHLGHQAILKPLVAAAHAAGSPAAVATFFPHPAVALRGADDPLYLTSPEERAALLGELGVDAVITLPFDQALAKTSAEDFMRRMARHLGLRALWVGDDFALGRGRAGTPAALRDLGETLGYGVQVIAAAAESGSRVSSSRIRAALREGEVAQAAKLLGRYYDLQGTVAHGDARGRTLGIPTANLQVWSRKLLPYNGVYVTWAWVGGQRVGAVTNIGARPTFDGMGVRIEAHLLDFDGDVYDQAMRLEFIDFVRPELRFESVQSLLTQIAHDTRRAREVLSHVA